MYPLGFPDHHPGLLSGLRQARSKKILKSSNCSSGVRVRACDCSCTWGRGSTWWACSTGVHCASKEMRRRPTRRRRKELLSGSGPLTAAGACRSASEEKSSTPRWEEIAGVEELGGGGRYTEIDGWTKEKIHRGGRSRALSVIVDLLLPVF